MPTGRVSTCEADFGDSDMVATYQPSLGGGEVAISGSSQLDALVGLEIAA